MNGESDWMIGRMYDPVAKSWIDQQQTPPWESVKESAEREKQTKRSLLNIGACLLFGALTAVAGFWVGYVIGVGT